jgi:hypothetical protein
VSVQINLTDPAITNVHLNPPKLANTPARVGPGADAKVLQTLTIICLLLINARSHCSSRKGKGGKEERRRRKAIEQKGETY